MRGGSSYTRTTQWYRMSSVPRKQTRSRASVFPREPLPCSPVPGSAQAVVWVAVETAIPDRRPHRSVRAQSSMAAFDRRAMSPSAQPQEQIAYRGSIVSLVFGGGLGGGDRAPSLVNRLDCWFAARRWRRTVASGRIARAPTATTCIPSNALDP